jgi:hypothetical protein
MLAQKLQILIDAEDKATKKIEGVGKSVQNAQKQMKAAGVAAGVMGGAIVGFLGLSVKAAAEHEKQWNIVRQQVKLSGLEIESTTNSIKEFAGSVQMATGFSDEYVGSIVGKLLPATRDLEESKRMARIALDMETSGMINAETAVRALMLAHEGDITMLNRYIPSIRTLDKEMLANMTVTEKYELAMGELEKQFGGLSEAAGDTLEGQLKILKETFGDLQEEIGMKLIPNITELIKKITPTIQSAIKWSEKNEWLSKSLVYLTAALGGLLLTFSALTLIGPGVVALFGAGTLGPILLITSAIALLSGEFLYLIDQLRKVKYGIIELKDAFKDGFIVGRIGNWLGEKLLKLNTLGSRQFGGPINETGLYQLHKGEHVLPADKSMGNTFNFDFSGANIVDKDNFVREITKSLNRGAKLASMGL